MYKDLSIRALGFHNKTMQTALATQSLLKSSFHLVWVICARFNKICLL